MQIPHFPSFQSLDSSILNDLPHIPKLVHGLACGYEALSVVANLLAIQLWKVTLSHLHKNTLSFSFSSYPAFSALLSPCSRSAPSRVRAAFGFLLLQESWKLFQPESEHWKSTLDKNTNDKKNQNFCRMWNLKFASSQPWSIIYNLSILVLIFLKAWKTLNALHQKIKWTF